MSSSLVDANVYVDKHNPVPVLTRACEDGLYDFVKVLLEHGAIVSLLQVIQIQLEHSYLLLPLALYTTSVISLFQLFFVLYNVYFDFQISENGPVTQIPLMIAATNGYCDVIQLLVDKGANINVQVRM